ncbi:DUF6153 family protein [Streptomyces sp. WZ.A104]|uniref:DUF6153 family protein n=1 Tax=Streptomyces sp. WZ.A104 TaxID=2023771 RepID=UPI0015C86609|nr:DUF6153 family protein [Streptomyces sp. WZ.A104]
MAARARNGSGKGAGSGSCQRFLLFTALLFGVFTMHTVGHPAEHSTPPSAAEAVGATTTAEAAEAAANAAHTAPSGHHPDAPMSGMDPLSVCLAVLGVWGLALAGSRLPLRARTDGRPAGTHAGAGLPRVLRANPPPRISVLASVSVLRI